MKMYEHLKKLIMSLILIFNNIDYEYLWDAPK